MPEEKRVTAIEAMKEFKVFSSLFCISVEVVPTDEGTPLDMGAMSVAIVGDSALLSRSIAQAMMKNPSVAKTVYDACRLHTMEAHHRAIGG